MDKKIKTSEFKGKTIGIDGYFWLYQILTAIRGATGQDLTSKNGEIITHTYGLLMRLVKLLQYGAEPIVVFDGPAPLLKQQTLDLRKKKRKDAQNELEKSQLIDKKRKLQLEQRSTILHPDQIKQVKQMLTIFGIRYVQARNETDSELVNMQKEGIIDYIMSDDSDILVFGGTNIIRNYNAKKKVFQFLDRDELESNGWHDEKIATLAILLGTDYNYKIPRVGPKTADKLVNKNMVLREIIEQYKTVVSKEQQEIFFKVLKYYTSAGKKQLTNKIKQQLEQKEIDQNLILDYLENKLCLDPKKIEKIVKLF
jgi:5'-3' exonuclease